MKDRSLAALVEKMEPLRNEFKALTTENDAIVEAVKVEDGVIVIDGEKRAKFQANLKRLGELRDTLEQFEQQKQILEWGKSTTAEPSAAMLAAAAGSLAAQGFILPRRGIKSIGQAFVESEEFKAFQKSGLLTMPGPVTFKADLTSGVVIDTERKDVYGSLPTAGTGFTGDPAFGTRQRDALIERAQRRVRVRDLFPVVNTNAATVEYFRVTGFTNNASVVPQRSGAAFAPKPQSTLTFSAEQAPLRTIAHWEAAHRDVLSDEPQLQGIIENELLYGLRLHEDLQLLSGSGSGSDIRGILNVTGIGTHAVGADTPADGIRKAITKVLLAYYEPTGIVLHPNDWEQIELLKDTTGRYIVAASVDAGAQPRLWRLPVVDTPAITEGTGLVGAFGIGATMYDREEASIRIAEQHSDFFVRNAVVILAEERIGLAVKRPESFVKVTGL